MLSYCLLLRDHFTCIHLEDYYVLSYFVHNIFMMVQNCCVMGCKNVWTPDSSIAYHTFPIKDKKRLTQWMQIDELKNINVTATKRICSAHFTSESFEEYCTVKKLKKSAIPSLFNETVQVMDNSPTEIIEIWEEICIDSVPEKTTTTLDKIIETEQEVQEQEQEKQKVEQIKHQVEQKEMGQETREILQSNKEKYDFPAINVIKTKDACVQTISAYYEYREEIWKLRKKLSTLRQQIRHREASISNTRKYIHILTNSKDSRK